ncbi:magnesium transporter [Lachnospiraceae bacterium KM106-2]|nr:magnesium transporter [Lachnospiraceae bacterium KM106-2]
MRKEIITFLRNSQYNELKNYLMEMNSADVAQILVELSPENMLFLFRLLEKDMAADTFAYMESEFQEKLIRAMSDAELKDVVSKLYLDDTVALIGELPANLVKRILKQTQPSQRALINEFLKYPSDSAGSFMTIEFVDLKASMTVKEAIDRIRKVGVNKETIYTCYVLDKCRRLEGIVTVKGLLLAENDTCISEIMNTNPIMVTTLEDKENVAKKFEKYDLLSMPVVDQENRLVGIITIDDAMDVMQEENTEDFTKMAAISPSEDSYFGTSVFKHARNRFVWLLALMLSATVTGLLITKYENAFAVVPLLVSFIPMLMDTGGNCGSQSSTLVIRGLAIEEFYTKDFLRVLWKEIRVSLLVGVGLAVVNGIRIVIQYNDVSLAVVVGLTLICTVALSKCLGCILPMLAKKMNLDPALMAAPLITTVVDTCSIIIYFTIATHIMNL